MGAKAKDTTEAIVDGILRFVAAGGIITTATLAPNAVQIFGKPLIKILKKLDTRQRQRELRRITHYMKQKGWIHYSAWDYEHGIVLTKSGKEKLKQRNFANLAVPTPKSWDKKWRLIFFDIPETDKQKRNSFNLKLKHLGFKQLQISIWVHPFPCRAEIESVCEVLSIRKFVTYVEIDTIDSEKQLRSRFNHLIS